MSKISLGSFLFNHETQEWSLYKDRLEQWFLANDIGEEADKSGSKRRAILLSSFAEQSYKLVRDLALPAAVGSLDYQGVVSLLDKHFKAKKCGFAERARFHTAVQQQHENLAEWAARVRGLAIDCSFAANTLDETLRDRFVIGMTPGPERDQLFTKELENLTMSKALEISDGVRSARLGAQQSVPGSNMAGLANPTESVHVLKMSAKQNTFHAAPGRSPGQGATGVSTPATTQRPNSSDTCTACGYTGHRENSCRFTRYKCKKCGVKGHLKRMCPNKSQNFIECCSDNNDDDGKRIIFNIRTYHGEPMKESVLVNGIEIVFEVDTGSAVTVISEDIYKLHFSHLELKSSNIILQSYNGNSINTLGKLSLNFFYRNKTSSLDVYVVRNGGPPLLGRDFIASFNLQILAVKMCTDSNFTKQLISKYPKLFSDQLGCCNNFVVSLNLKPNSKPIYFRPRPLPFAIRQSVEGEIDRLVKLGVLEPVKYSEYASPIVPVLKHDHNIRLCADYSVTINKQLLVEKYPLPRTDELFTKLHGGIQFSKLDLSQAYNQFRLDESSQMLTCINTHKGLFKYTRLVFGLSSAPAIFQRAMETILSGLDGVLLFLDDILICGRNQNEHLERLHEVFKRLEQAGLVLQKEKCSFFQDSVSYLGFVIDRYGIHKSPEKVKAMLEAKTPTNLNELKSFLGMVNYYRNFINNASSILCPLHKLLQKNVSWKWEKEHDDAVSCIKRELASESTLAHFNPDAQLILTVDASPNGLGAILSQIDDSGIEKPVSFMSRSLSNAEKNYSQIQKEATAIVFGVRKYHQFLYGRSEPFILKTDHKPLLSIFSPEKGIPEVSANRLQRYAIFLSAYNFKIEYVSSAHNSADFLSRSVKENPHHQLNVTDNATYVRFVCEGDRFLSLSEISNRSQSDDILSKCSDYILNGWPKKLINSALKPFFDCRQELAIENGCIMRGHRLIVPQGHRIKVLDELHKGHLGITKMKCEARNRFWWPGMSTDIERRAASCRVCAALRPAPPRAPLTPWPFPPRPWHRVHIDLLGPISNKVFLIVVDAYSKWVECFDVSSGYSSRIVIEKLCEVMARFGLFHTLCSDNGSSFTSSEFQQFCVRNGIIHLTSPPYNPASNGQAESYVKIIKKAIKSIILSGTNSKDLNNKLQEFLLCYRNSKHNTTDRSPSEILFGQSLRCRLDLINPKTVSSSDAALDKIVKDKQCLQCDNYAGSRIVSFEVGELVLVKDYRSQKSNWTQGVIVEKQGNSLFLVRLLNTDQIFRRHKNQMLKYKGEGRSNGNNHQYEVSNTDVTEEVFIPPFVFGQFASTADLSGEEGNTSATIPDCNRSTESLSSSSSAATTVGGTGNIQNDSVAQELESSLHEETETGPTGSGEPPQFMNLPAGTVVQTKEHSKRNRPRIDYRKYF